MTLALRNACRTVIRVQRHVPAADLPPRLERETEDGAGESAPGAAHPGEEVERWVERSSRP